MSNGSVQTKYVPDPIKQQKVNVATKEKQPIIAIEFEETKSKSSKEINESNEEFDPEKEPEKEDEAVPAKIPSKPYASTKDKGQGIQFLDTQGYVATKAFSPLFFFFF